MDLVDLLKCCTALRAELRLGALPLYVHKVDGTRHGCNIVFSDGRADERYRAEFRVAGVLHKLTKFLG